MLHAGTRNGWVENATLVVKSKQQTGNYHDEMNQHNSEEWFIATLLPKLAANSIIVMDNAPYHSRRKEPIPTKSWTKSKMREWLHLHVHISSKEITYTNRWRKCDIWNTVEKNKPRISVFVIDKVTSLAGKVWSYPQK